tara:strand:- start:1817 stop:2296 length:480 start_codon:yes stop_codon:yes gene_type:complete
MGKLDELQSLKELLDSGLLTEEEFVRMKNEIIQGVTNESDKTVNINDEIKDNDSVIPSSEVKNPGTITVSFEGQYFLFDVKTKIFLNGNQHSSHSTKKGFSSIIPFTDDNIELKISLAGMKSTTFNIEELDSRKEYFLKLEYDVAWGKYSDEFKFEENG